MSNDKPSVDRRKFLTAAAVSGAAAVAAPTGGGSAQAQGVAGFTKPPSAADMEAEIGQPVRIAATMKV